LPRVVRNHTADMADAERPERRPGILYVDTSALLKLLVREAESEAIETELLQWSKLATSVVTEVELPRAIARAREERPDAVIDGSVVLQGVLASAAIVPLGAGIVAKARDVSPVHVGALDAIHVASALSLGRDLTAVATYDHRMQDALARIKVEVLAPEPQPEPDDEDEDVT
jgi:predicted nucleic acid-binding protein